MKSRIRRIWLSVSLAFGSLTMPAVGFVQAHDLPIRWSSGSNSTSSWNYLLDDCLDTPIWYDTSNRNLLPPHCMLNSPSAALSNLTLAGQAPLGSIASDSLITESLPRPMGSNGCVEDFDTLLSRSSLARYSSEMSCWVSSWEQLQQQAGESVRRDLHKYRLEGTQANTSEEAELFAALPADELPPAPPADALRRAMLAFANAAEPQPMEDTCAFEREYRSQASTASELDDADQANSSDIDYEALVLEMAQAADAERLAAKERGAEVERDANRCGPQDFGLDSRQVIADDLSQTDMHWLGGLGKAWRLQASAQTSSVPTSSISSVVPAAVRLEEEIAAAMIAPEDWMPPAPVDAYDAEVADNASSVDPTLSLLLNSGAQQAADWAASASESVDSWQRSAAFAWQATRYLAAPLAYQTTNAMPSVTDGLGLALAWVEEFECVMTAELCGLDSAYLVGQQLSSAVQIGARESTQLTTAILAQLDMPPAVANPEMFVIYTDIDGMETAIPASLARAWNRPEFDNAASTTDALNSAMDTAMTGAIAEERHADIEQTASMDLVALQSELLVMVARQLDAIGIACLQTADEIHNWADNQIASRNETSNR